MKSLKYRSLLMLAALLMVFCTGLKGQADDCETMMQITGIHHDFDPSTLSHHFAATWDAAAENPLPTEYHEFYIFHWIIYAKGGDTLFHSLQSNFSTKLPKTGDFGAILRVTGVKQGDDDFRIGEPRNKQKIHLPPARVECWEDSSFNLEFENTTVGSNDFRIGFDPSWYGGRTMGMKYPVVFHVSNPCSSSNSFVVTLSVSPNFNLVYVPNNHSPIVRESGSIDFSIELEPNTTEAFFAWIEIPPDESVHEFEEFTVSIKIISVGCFLNDFDDSEPLRLNSIDPCQKFLLSNVDAISPGSTLRYRIDVTNLGDLHAKEIYIFDRLDPRLKAEIDLTSIRFKLNGKSFILPRSYSSNHVIDLGPGGELGSEPGHHWHVKFGDYDGLKKGETLSLEFNVELLNRKNLKKYQGYGRIGNTAYSRFSTDDAWYEGKAKKEVSVVKVVLPRGTNTIRNVSPEIRSTPNHLTPGTEH